MGSELDGGDSGMMPSSGKDVEDMAISNMLQIIEWG